MRFPGRGFITKIEQAKGRIRILGDIELVEKHMRSYDIVRRPLQSIAADVIKRSAPEFRYIVRDDAGHVVLAGQIPIAADKSFELDLRNIPAGSFTLSAQIIVNGNAMNAEIRNFAIEAGRAD